VRIRRNGANEPSQDQTNRDEERKGYPAAPAKLSELPKVPKGPAPGSNGGSTSSTADKTR
jgi:hypothetical protein